MHKTVYKSLKFALSGLGFAISNNMNMQIHILITIAVLGLAWFFQIERSEFLALVVMIVLVMSAEMINTSIEEMTNLITREHREEAKIAKDVSAGMVLVVSVGAAIIGFYIFIPYILNLFQIY
jgi:diacylglycerol kinase